jgi:DNA (cytosine-5)-methyltransferase 1
MAIRYFDLFSGIGGFRSGLTLAGGFECVGHCEIDPYANRAYEAIYQPKGELYFENARDIRSEDLPDIDLIAAGFPCQSFSLAGRRLGFHDTRGTLFFEAARIAEAKRSSFLLLENVPGLLSHDGGRTFKTILSALADLGYHIEWCVLNSANFGVPQQRKRLYIVASLGAECAGKIFPLSGGTASDLKELVHGPQGQRVYEISGSACTQCAEAGGWGGKTGLYFIDLNERPSLTEQARCITARQDSGVSYHRGEHSAVFLENDTVGSGPGMITVTDQNGITRTGRVRRLLPIECWRLQGFSDEQFHRAKATGLSDGRLYKMAGNAVSVPVIFSLGRKIRELNEQYHITERRNAKCLTM